MEQIYDSFDAVEVIAEMGTGASTLVPLSPEIVEQLSEGDDSPTFVTFIIEGGWSKQKRYWPDDVVNSIAEQINNASEPVVGYMGHIKPDDDGFTFPDIQMQWLKAKIQPSSDRIKLLAKAYVLPQTKARDYIKRRLVRSVSVRGDGEEVPMQGGRRVKEFTLESIDLSRPRKSGMKSALVSVTSEMEGGKVKAEEIAALQENELRAHSPTLVQVIEANAKKPLEDKIAEMEKKEEENDSDDKLKAVREALGVDEDADPLEVIQKMLAKAKETGKSLREKILDDVLSKKFKDETTRSLVRRILVSEMSANGEKEEEEPDETKITEMVNKTIDEDETLRKAVESAGGHSLPGGKGEFTGKKFEPGHDDEYVTVSKGGR